MVPVCVADAYAGNIRDACTVKVKEKGKSKN